MADALAARGYRCASNHNLKQKFLLDPASCLNRGGGNAPGADVLAARGHNCLVMQVRGVLLVRGCCARNSLCQLHRQRCPPVLLCCNGLAGKGNKQSAGSLGSWFLLTGGRRGVQAVRAVPAGAAVAPPGQRSRGELSCSDRQSAAMQLSAQTEINRELPCSSVDGHATE